MISEIDLSTIDNITFLFDLDGVIFYSEDYYTQFWSEQAIKHNVPCSDFAKQIKGHGLNDIFDEYFPNQHKVQQEIIKDLEDLESTMDFHYVKGARELLELLSKTNIKKCLVTSSKNNKMEYVFKKRPEMKQFFPLMVTASDIKHAKPSPDCYLQAAKLMNSEPQKCVVFEDSLAGMQAAKTAGAKIIALSTTLTEKEISSNADKIIRDFSCLEITHIRSLFN